MGIGSKLENLLKEKNIKVSELARAVDIAPTTIYSIINRNNKKVDIDILLAISDYLGVKAEYFRDGSSESSTPSTLTTHEQELIGDYRRLNHTGKEEAGKRVHELTMIPEYKKDTGLFGGEGIA